jgi:hypothetical protein
MFYWYGGGTVAEPSLYEPPKPRTTAGGVAGIREARHLNSTLHHMFGYAYVVSGDAEFLRMGDEVFDASYGEGVDGIHGQADSGKAKDYDQNFRASGRYLVWRLLDAQTRARAQAGAQPSGLGTEAGGRGASGAAGLISQALLRAGELSSSVSDREQVAEFVRMIEEAQRAFLAEQGQFAAPEGVLEELNAALGHARTALAVASNESSPYENTKSRLGWAAARLKRARERLKPK